MVWRFWSNLSCVTNENRRRKLFLRNIVSCKNVWKSTMFRRVIRLKYLFRIFFMVGNKLTFNFTLFCTMWCSKKIWREIDGEAILDFLPRKLSGETLCKFLQIFPPKDLVYIGHIFYWHLFNYLIAFCN